MSEIASASSIARELPRSNPCWHMDMDMLAHAGIADESLRER